MSREISAFLCFVAAASAWFLIDGLAFAGDGGQTITLEQHWVPTIIPPTCDSMLMQAGLVDSDNRYEFVVPFDADPECQCSPAPCEWHASREDVVLSNVPKRPKEAKAPRIVCWGKR